MRPIIKVKNPVLRGLAGGIMVGFGLAIAMGVFYAIGLVALPVWGDFYSGFWPITGIGLLSLIFVAACTGLTLGIGYWLYRAARHLGEKFFDP